MNAAGSNQEPAFLLISTINCKINIAMLFPALRGFLLEQHTDKKEKGCF